MEPEPVQFTAGQRLRCEHCGSEAIVVKAQDAPPLTCCGAALMVIFSREPA